MFPEARLVLTKRSPDSWQRSMRETLVKVGEVVEEVVEVGEEVVEEVSHILHPGIREPD